MYISLSESRDEVLAVARSHGWSLEGIHMFEMQVGQKDFSDADENTLFEPSEVELREVMHRLLVEIDRVKAKRVVFDSLSELRLLAQHPLRCRKKTTGRSQAGDAGSGGYSPIRAGTRR